MKELIESYFNKVYDDTYNEVMGYVVARCSDINYVEDILQDSYAEFFSLICKKGAGYVNKPICLLKKIAKTKVYRYYKLKNKLNKLVPLHDDNKNSEEIKELVFDEVEDKYINAHTINQIWDYISASPPDIQKIFVLRFYMDKKIDQIATELKISPSNVKHKLYRTIERLRNYYSEDLL